VWLAFSLIACSGPEAPPPPPPQPPVVAPPPGPATQAPVMPLWERAPATEGRVRTDGIALWGWSDGEKSYAVETFDPGAGLSRCEGTAELAVIDVEAGGSVDGGAIVLQPANPDADPCPDPGPAEAMGQVRLGHLALHGVRPGGEATLVPLAAESEGDLTLILPDGRSARVKHEVTGDAKGTGYRLVVALDGTSHVLEDGSRTRTGVFATAPVGAFFSPSGKVVVLLLEARSREGETTHRAWLADALRLPDGPTPDAG
jgi:hypothetical protein